MRQWLKQSDLDAGRRSDGLTSDEREELRQLRRENQRLRQEKEILKKGGGLLRRGDQTDPIAVFEFLERKKAAFDVQTIRRTLGVSASGYYAWKSRPPCRRRGEDERLKILIAEIHRFSRGTSGTPRVRVCVASLIACAAPRSGWRV